MDAVLKGHASAKFYLLLEVHLLCTWQGAEKLQGWLEQLSDTVPYK